MAKTKLTKGILAEIQKNLLDAANSEIDEEYRKYCALARDEYLKTVPDVVLEVAVRFPQYFDSASRITAGGSHGTAYLSQVIDRADMVVKDLNLAWPRTTPPVVGDGQLDDSRELAEAAKALIELATQKNNAVRDVLQAIPAFSTVEELVEAVPGIEKFVPVPVEKSRQLIPIETIERAKHSLGLI